MTSTDRQFHIFGAVLAVLGAALALVAALAGGGAWWLAFAASAVTVLLLVRRLRSGDGRNDRTASSSGG